MPRKLEAVKAVKPLTEEELEQISVVFHQFETGVRSGAIRSQDLLACFKSVGLILPEQEIIDMTNEVEKKGVIYFEDYCKLMLRKYREEDEEEFIRIMFKHLCGTDPHPTQFRAKKYKVNERFIEKVDFLKMMQHLPFPVDPVEVNEMFDYADKDGDNKISWSEFQIMINPPPPPRPPTPHKSELVALFVTDNPAYEAEEASPEKVEESPPDQPDEEDIKGDQNGCMSSSKEHRKHCAICQSKVVKPVVETELSKAAAAFAKDSTSIQYSWRNEKGVFVEKMIQVKAPMD